MKLIVSLSVFLLSSNAIASSTQFEVRDYRGKSAMKTCLADKSDMTPEIQRASKDKINIYDIDCIKRTGEFAQLVVLHKYEVINRYENESVELRRSDCRETSKELEASTSAAGVGAFNFHCSASFHSGKKYAQLNFSYVRTIDHDINTYDSYPKFSRKSRCEDFLVKQEKDFAQAKITTLTSFCGTKRSFLVSTSELYTPGLIYIRPKKQTLKTISTQEFKRESACEDSTQLARTEVNTTSTTLVSAYCVEGFDSHKLHLVFMNKLMDRSIQTFTGLDKSSREACHENINLMKKIFVNEKKQTIYTYCQKREIPVSENKTVVYRPTILYKDLK